MLTFQEMFAETMMCPSPRCLLPKGVGMFYWKQKRKLSLDAEF